MAKRVKLEIPAAPPKHEAHPVGAGEGVWICPVIQDAQRMLKLGKSFEQAMRKLRQSQRLCQRCTSRGQCPAMLDLHSQINAAIAAITEEWDLY